MLLLVCVKLTTKEEEKKKERSLNQYNLNVFNATDCESSAVESGQNIFINDTQ
jgi:hypothetical protein